MKKYGIIFTFAAFLAGSILLYRFAGPQRADVALARTFAGLRTAQYVSGVAAFAFSTPDAGDAAEPLAARAAFAFALPSASAPGAGLAAFTFLGAAAGGADAFAEIRSLPDGQAYLRVDRLPLPGAASTDGKSAIDGAWWSLDRVTLGNMLLAGGLKNVLTETDAAAVDAEIPSTPLDATAIALRWQRVREALTGNELYTAGGRTMEIIDGSPAHRLTLGLRRAAAVELVRDAREALLGRELTGVEILALRRRVEASTATLMVWLDARSGDLIAARLDIDDASGDEMRSILFTALDFDTVVTVEAPTDAKPIEAALQALLPPAAE